MLSDGTWTYTWEHGRELASMTGGGVTWTFTYDANGMRTARTNGTTTYNYVYNGGQLSQMTVGSNTLNFAYDASGTPLSVVYNGTYYYYVTNLQGDVVAILNTSGTAVVTYTYDAWGKLLTTSGTMASTLGAHNPLRYRGYVYDPELGLYYLQSRYYNPELGRFINADAFVSTGQGLLSNNMFAYCINNPGIYSDPHGTRIQESVIRPHVYVDDSKPPETLGDYINSITPPEVNEQTEKVGNVLSKALYSGFEGAMDSIDQTLLLDILPCFFGKGELTLTAILIAAGGGFFFGLVHGFWDAIQEEYFS